MFRKKKNKKNHLKCCHVRFVPCNVIAYATMYYQFITVEY